MRYATHFYVSRERASRDRAVRVFPRNDDSANGPGQHPVRIVLAEDEAITALHVEFLLTGLGYDVCDVAASAPEAVKAAAEHRPDLVLMDIRLAEGTDGIAAAAEIRARFGTPVVYLTAHTDAATVRRAEATHPLGFISKPCSREQIETTLRQAVTRLQNLQDG